MTMTDPDIKRKGGRSARRKARAEAAFVHNPTLVRNVPVYEIANAEGVVEDGCGHTSGLRAHIGLPPYGGSVQYARQADGCGEQAWADAVRDVVAALLVAAALNAQRVFVVDKVPVLLVGIVP